MSSSRITYRAFTGDSRISTAVTLKTGEILQVYPSHSTFPTVDAWRSSVPAADRFTENEHIAAAAKCYSKLERGRERQFAEFLDPDYKWLITSISRVSDDTLHLVLNDGSTAIIQRCTNYLNPPNIWHNGAKLIIHEYTPAVTAVRWLIMLLFVTPTK